MSENIKDKLHISWSQFKTWRACPWSWKLTYIDKKSIFTDNIHTLFGKVMHTVIQTYLKTLYNSTIKEADELDLNKMLEDEMKLTFLQIKKETGEKCCTLDDMVEFYKDGVAILDFLKKKRAMYFSKKGYELAGIELKLEYDLPKNISFIGYIDLIIKDTIHNKIKIYDLKTSTRSWNKYKKADKEQTTDQLLLYKQFYSDQFNVPLDKIDVEFFILKRKLYENIDYPQRRIQTFTPANGGISLKNVNESFSIFIDECFTDKGEYNTVRDYKKIPSPNNCRFCDYKDDPTLCDKAYK